MVEIKKLTEKPQKCPFGHKMKKLKEVLRPKVDLWICEKCNMNLWHKEAVAELEPK